MRRVIIAGLAVLAAVLGSASAPVNAATAATGSPALRVGSAAGTTLLALNGVSCVSDKFCAAVGAQGPVAGASQGYVPLAMIWNGKRWLKSAARLLAHASQGELDSVSCTSAAYCVAVGDAPGGTGSGLLAETWNGRTWTPVTLPAGGPAAGGLTVSCGAARSCAAVGFYAVPGGPEPFLETLSGTKWTVRVVPATFVAFGAISCVSASHCVLGGTYVAPPNPLVNFKVDFESWNGEAFTKMKAASAGEFVSAINGLSCATAKACAAIGTVNAPASQPYAQSFAVGSWNGRIWSVASVAGPKGYQNQLNDLSCTPNARCVAVGVSSTDGKQDTSHALAVSYDGRSWTTTRVPALRNGGSSALNGVSCVSAAWCAAVGEGGGPDGQLLSGAALTAFWNGKTWRLVTAP